MPKRVHRKKDDDSESHKSNYGGTRSDHGSYNEDHRFRRRAPKRYSSKDIVRLSFGFFLFITCLKFYTKAMLSSGTLNQGNRHEQGSYNEQKRNNDATLEFNKENIQRDNLYENEPTQYSNYQKSQGTSQQQKIESTMTYTKSKLAPDDTTKEKGFSASSANDHLFDEDAALHFDPNAAAKDFSQQTSMISRHATKPTVYAKPNPDLEIPFNIDSKLADVAVSSVGSTDVPLFWHILKSGGTTVKDFYGECFRFIEATESGVLAGHDADETLQVVQLSPDEGSIRYVNVDTTTAPGIERAIKLNLVPTNMADIIFTPLLHESSEMFNENQRAQMFGLFRHPVERAVSLFHYLKKATWEPTFSKEIKKIKTIEDYAISIFAEDNWMVRFLTNKMTEMVTRKDLEIAKEILRRKCLVGVIVDIEGSIKRFNQYFGWNDKIDLTNPFSQQCVEKYLSGGSNKNTHELVEEGGMGWKILRANNLLDLELYEYVLQLYEEQGALFPSLTSA